MQNQNLKLKTILFFGLFILAIAIFFLKESPRKKSMVTIGKTSFFVEIVTTPEEKVRGLARHKPLLDNEGMFFVFEKGMARAFWMKGMTFPIDIIWIKDNKVSYVVEDAPISSFGQSDYQLPIYTPPKPADYVLEIKAGLTKKNNIKLGDRVTIF